MDVKRIRIGNDITISWKILRAGVSEKFDGKVLSVQLLDSQERPCEITYTIESNIINIAFGGKNQHSLGTYTLLLIENEGLDNMSTLDQLDAFMLVENTEGEGGENPCSQLSVYKVDLTSEFIIQHRIEVIDNLQSNSAKDALSARQGKVLKQDMMNLDKKIPYKVSDLDNDLNFVEKDYVDSTNLYQNSNILKEKKRNDEQDALIGRNTEDIANRVVKRNGYGLSQNDFNNYYKSKLDSLKNYDDSSITNTLMSVKQSLDALMGFSESDAIDNIEEIERFLSGFKDSQGLFQIIEKLDKRIKALENK